MLASTTLAEYKRIGGEYGRQARFDRHESTAPGLGLGGCHSEESRPATDCPPGALFVREVESLPDKDLRVAARSHNSCQLQPPSTQHPVLG